MRADELDYPLPKELIAQYPTARREAARLLVATRSGNDLAHASIVDLPRLLPPALFVFNDTRVLPARITGERPGGGQFELLLVERQSQPGREERWLAMGRPLKRLRAGTRVQLGELSLCFGERVGESMLEVTLQAAREIEAALAEVGRLPLPPYIDRAPTAADDERYQTVYARRPGAVAAPTAGLHFGQALLDALDQAGHRRAFVTLHVGPGTFAPLAVDDLRDHPMHHERYEIPAETVAALAWAKAEGRPVVAVGTTVVRTLEASARRAGEVIAERASTDLCIYPPYAFQVIDALLTNFHLPRSTLLALVMAFLGKAETEAAYRAAVAQRYRFFSYGDAMLIRPAALGSKVTTRVG